VERDVKLAADAYVIKVASTRLALARLSATYYNKPSSGIRVIGVTGTNGKTTITYLLQSILRAGGFKVGRLSTINYDLGDRTIPAPITTPESLDLQHYLSEMVAFGAQYACMEVSSHALSLGRVAEVNFAWAIFTNLSPEHLDFHGTMQHYLEAKARLFEGMPSEGRALVNRDDPAASYILTHSACPTVTFGSKRDADYRGVCTAMNKEGTAFTVHHGNYRQAFHLRLAGIHNMYNALAAIALALEEGIDTKAITEGLLHVPGIPGRLERLSTNAPFDIYVDYAHTPDSLEKSLKSVRALTRNRLILVFGCGGDRDRSKRPVMGRIASDLADFTIVTSDNPRSENPLEIIADIEKGMTSHDAGKRKRYVISADRRQALKRAIALAERGDSLLVAGKGHEKVQILADRTVPFDDRQVLLELLRDTPLI
jgi:UDP-N-acetylmuramoyl-L-alanyl-D-glutamate--2,6-diaminopimelate ligase